MSDEKISISIDVTGAEESAKKVEQVASETEKLNRAAGEVNKTPITPKAQTAEATKQLTTYREQLSLLQRKYEELSKLINDGKLTSKSKYDIGDVFGAKTIGQLEKTISDVSQKVQKVQSDYSAQTINDAQKRYAALKKQAYDYQQYISRIPSGSSVEESKAYKSVIDKMNVARSQMGAITRKYGGIDTFDAFKEQLNQQYAFKSNKASMDAVLKEEAELQKQRKAQRDTFDKEEYNRAKTNNALALKEQEKANASASKELRKGIEERYDLLSKGKEYNAVHVEQGYYQRLEQEQKKFSARLKQSMLEQQKYSEEIRNKDLIRFKDINARKFTIDKNLAKLRDENSPIYNELKTASGFLTHDINWFRKKYQDDFEFDSILQSYRNKMTSFQVGLATRQQQIDERNAIRQSAKQAQIQEQPQKDINPKSINTWRGYSAEIAKAQANAEKLHHLWTTGQISQKTYTNGINGIVDKTRELRKEMEAVPNVLKKTENASTFFSDFAGKLKSHLHWIVAGELIRVLAAVPFQIDKITTEFDSLERKIAQNLELNERYAGQQDLLKKDSEGLVRDAGKMANVYGVQVGQSLEMMQIMSRRFKNPEELTYFTNLAMIMSKLDFVTPAVSAETLESVVLSFGLTAKEASSFVDQFSIATHSMRINGEDLLQALQRSAPMLKAWNMDTAESIAMISSLSTTLGREGKYIGTALNGMFSRPLNPTNIKALEEVGISFRKANGEAKSGIQLLDEYYQRFKNLTEAARKEEVNKIFGAYRFAPAMSILQNWELFKKTLDQINDKANQGLTIKLLSQQLESLESQNNRFNNSFKILAYEIGKTAIPSAMALSKAITYITMAIGDNGSAIGKLFIALFKLVTTFATAKGAMFLFNQMTSRSSRELARAEMATVKLSLATLRASAANRTFGASFLALVGHMTKAIWAISKTTIMLAVLSAVADSIMSKYSEYQDDNMLDDYYKSRSSGGLRDVKGDTDESDAGVKAIQILREKRAAKEKAEREYEDIKIEYAQTARLPTGSQDEADAKYQKGKEAFDKATKEYEQARKDAITIVTYKNETETFQRYGILNPDNKSIEGIDNGSNDQSMVNTADSKKAGKEEQRKFKTALSARIEALENIAKMSKKYYEEDMDNLSFNEELFGKSPQSILKKVQLKLNRVDDIDNQVKAFEALAAEKSGELSSGFWDTLKEKMDSTFGDPYSLGAQLGSGYWDCGLWTEAMLESVGIKLEDRTADGQAKILEGAGKFFTNQKQLKRGDTVYWTGTGGKQGYRGISHTGIYMGDGMVRQAGTHGVSDIALDTYNVVGYGRTSEGGFNQEELEEMGADSKVYQRQAMLQQKVNKLREDAENGRKESQDILRELKKMSTIPFETKISEKRDRTNDLENISLLNENYERNAWNPTKQNRIKLHYAYDKLATNEEDWSKTVRDRENLEKQINEIKSKSLDSMSESEREKETTTLAILERELQVTKDTEAKKVLAVKQSQKEIEDLEYKKTEAIRNGLYSITNDLLLQGKNFRDVWNNLWTNLADEALRALMGIKGGQQSTLGAIAAQMFGLNKPKAETEKPEITTTNNNTLALKDNTTAINTLINAIQGGKTTLPDTNTKAKDTAEAANKALETVANTAKKTAKSTTQSPNTNNVAVTTTAIIAGLSMLFGGNKKANKVLGILSIAAPFITRGKGGGATHTAGKGKKTSHDGSIIGVSSLATKYYHSGGNVGTMVTPYLKSDEVNAVLQTGEEVVSRKDRRSNEIMAEQNKFMASAMQRMAEQSNNNITFAIQAIDSKSVVQLLSENGDAIMNILRKQSQLGNGRY